MASTNTLATEPTLEAALAAVPTSFRAKLIDSYRSLKSAYSNGQHDACGLRAGRFCETLLRYVQHHLTGNHIPFGTKIPNFEQECAKLEQVAKTAGPESLRVIIPRGLNFLYTLRNKRGIGHVGGDVDANSIDAATMVRVADWCSSELIRVVHNLPLEEAQALLDAITERQIPEVWSVVGKKRVLMPGLDAKAQTLLLLYSDLETAIPAEDLCEWVEYSTLSNYRRVVLTPLHSARLIEHDRDTDTVVISPTGIEKVEQELLKPAPGSPNAKPTSKRRRNSQRS
ncbi:MAG: hypothetical protein JO352_18080 [Chloroflexi bacterium]|nr:hypothetical protein [Chloroflexota bacterium]MBV9595913.1 hypothetical protein [Chloroflexota bacterium]